MNRNTSGIIAAGIGALMAFGFLPFFCPMPARAELFSQINLVTDDQTINPAMVTDPNLKNAWGISFAPASPFWVSDNGSGVATLYNVNPVTNATTNQLLVVSIPPVPNGSPTGKVFNTGGCECLQWNLFLFVSEDGTISGWRGALGTAAETLQLPDSSERLQGDCPGDDQRQHGETPIFMQPISVRGRLT